MNASRVNLKTSNNESTSHRFAVFALGSSAYPNFCSFGKFVDNILGELGGERLMKIVLGDDLCGQEQEFRKWACLVFKTSCEVFCLDVNEMSEASMSLKSETLTKENTRLQVVKDLNIPLSALLSKYHNKKVQACRVKNKPINLHGGATSERSTVLVEIIIDSVSSFHEETNGKLFVSHDGKLKKFPNNFMLIKSLFCSDVISL